jgi:murein DD-endopeptidase MepM/ murein hydrolase activator NlpD
MDFGGKDTGCDVVYAPFTGRVARVRTNSSHETYFESLEPVEFADGTVDYMTVTLMHDNVLDVRTGQVLHQGEKIGDEGGFGGGRPNRFGAHLHLEVSRGRNIAYQVRNAQGTYCTPQQVDIWSALWLGTDVQVLDGAGYSWKRDTKEDDDMKFLKVTNGKCEVFTTTDVNAVDKSYNSGKLTEGVCYPVQAEVGSSGGYNWVRIFVAGEKRYAVVLSDRCQLVTLSPGDAFNACVAQAKPQAADPEIEKKLAAETLRADTAERERDAANKKINEAKKALGA